MLVRSLLVLSCAVAVAACLSSPSFQKSDTSGSDTGGATDTGGGTDPGMPADVGDVGTLPVDEGFEPDFGMPDAPPPDMGNPGWPPPPVCDGFDCCKDDEVCPDNDFDGRPDVCVAPGRRTECDTCFEVVDPCTDDLECGGFVCDRTREPCACNPAARECVPPCEPGDCAETQRCVEGKCLDIRCDNGGSCPILHSCRGNGSCARTACASDGDCGGAFCVNGFCYQKLGTCRL